MEEENAQKKRPLELDWNQILDQNDNTEPLPLLVIKGPQKQDHPSLKPSPPSSMSIVDHPLIEDLARWTDRDLEDRIKRQKNNIVSLSPRLSDGGEKLRGLLKACEDEQRRRKLSRPEADVEICEKPSQLISSGKIDDFKRENALSQVPSQSEFASFFSRKIEENTDRSAVKAFDKELSILGRCSHPESKSSGAFSQRRRHKGQSSSRKMPFQCARSLSHNREKHASNGDLKGKISTNPFRQNGESVKIKYSKKTDVCQVLPSNGSRLRKGQTVVLLDEDEGQLREEKEQEHQLAECMKDSKIYYPSRDDRESVEICYMDISSLDPKSFLTSPIMNFYIRYLRLQTSPTNKAVSDCHFFNTFFYKKLKQAVSYKGSDKESFFIKFRRWWKGVNIFQKAYVLIPIHEDLHWSLVIICIPDKEDESGPIILHLDSLGFHYSKAVFDEIKSYLRQEWDYLMPQVASSEIPIAERIWNHLPRRIEEKKIEVPQQKNDYDCGLFVLYFMERFIEEAPERLKKKDLAMFGKRWFRPEEASGLRVKIRKLLVDEFKNASEIGCVSESPHSPSGVASP